MDLLNNIVTKVALVPTVIADNTTTAGEVVDLGGYGSATFVIATGTLADADATFAVTMQHGNASDFSDAANVDAGDLIGTLAGAGFKFDDDKVTKKIGYIGNKRYVKITITPSGNSGNAPVSAIAILGNPRKAPNGQ